MTNLNLIAVVLAILGSAVIGGVFFAFSSFIMKALARLPGDQGIAAMQSINVVVLNATFLGTFVGTAAISLLVAGLAVQQWGASSAPWYLAGAVSYLAGTFLVTGLGNVPLNNRLADVPAGDPAAIEVWEHYLKSWTRLNTIRTVAALAAVLMFVTGLIV
jgi:uncharacterized membrane protein